MLVVVEVALDEETECTLEEDVVDVLLLASCETSVD